VSTSKPSRTARERRGHMIFTGVIIAVVLVFAASAVLRSGAVPLWAFLGLTAAGIAVALVGYAAGNHWIRLLLVVVVLGVVLALTAASMVAASVPFAAGAFVGGLLSRDEWPWRRTPEERLRESQPRSLASIGPWSGSGLRATLADVPIGRRRETETGVLLEAGDVAQRFRVDELHRLANGRGDMAESVDADRPEVPDGTVYLVRVDTASPDSIIGEVLVGLPGDALALVPIGDPMTGPVAVLTGSDAASFRAWVTAIPAP